MYSGKTGLSGPFPPNVTLGVWNRLFYRNHSRRWIHAKSQLNHFWQSNSLPSGHPVKGASLRSASLRDGYAALDWGLAFGHMLCL
jgi:hypothetical protein